MTSHENDLMLKLTDWYKRHFNGEWEKAQAIQFGTIENPGWYLRVALVGTPYVDMMFEAVSEERSEDDWIHCRKKDGFFEGGAAPGNLAELIEAFLAWAV